MNDEVEKMLNHMLLLEGTENNKMINFHLETIKSHLYDIFGFQNDKKINPSITYLIGKGMIVLINKKSKIYNVRFDLIKKFLGSL